MEIVTSALTGKIIHYWWAFSGKPTPKITVPLWQLVQFYVEEGQDERIDGEVAFCQAILETGWFQYKLDVQPEQNNFAGLGATGGVQGLWFPSARIGARAHIQHLKAYATPNITEADLAHPCVDSRFRYVKKGSAQKWEDLGGGNWAPAADYGYKVLDVYARMTRGE